MNFIDFEIAHRQAIIDDAKEIISRIQTGENPTGRSIEYYKFILAVREPEYQNIVRMKEYITECLA